MSSSEQLDPKSIKTGLFYFDWITDTFSAYAFDSISVRVEERDDEGSKRTRGALEMHYTPSLDRRLRRLRWRHRRD
jgi:hypothetical protein